MTTDGFARWIAVTFDGNKRAAARALGVSPTTVHAYLAGTRIPRVVELAAQHITTQEDRT